MQETFVRFCYSFQVRKVLLRFLIKTISTTKEQKMNKVLLSNKEISASVDLFKFLLPQLLLLLPFLLLAYIHSLSMVHVPITIITALQLLLFPSFFVSAVIFSF